MENCCYYSLARILISRVLDGTFLLHPVYLYMKLLTSSPLYPTGLWLFSDTASHCLKLSYPEKRHLLGPQFWWLESLNGPLLSHWQEPLGYVTVYLRTVKWTGYEHRAKHLGALALQNLSRGLFQKCLLPQNNMNPHTAANSWPKIAFNFISFWRFCYCTQGVLLANESLKNRPHQTIV